MSFDGSEKPDYVVPRYRAGDDTAFYHFLHGTVPGHQIDFLYRPDVPQGALTQTHFGHLARLIKYIEPRAKAAYAFALGNLSRDDIQHEPGHGGLALLFALRVPGLTDHAGRDMLPYAHGVVAVNRELDHATLFDAATVFHRRFLEQQGADNRGGSFYRTYVQTAEEQPGELEQLLARYITEFSELPHPKRSELGWDFVADEGAPAKRITIVHDDDEGFDTLAQRAAALGSLLYRSNIKWTSITSGRETDIVGGTTIRFVARSDASSEAQGARYAIEELPDDEEELAMLLFGAKRRAPEAVVARQGWREKLAAQRGSSARTEPPAPPRTPLPPPPDAPARHDSVDRAEVDRAEIDDAAATLPMAPLEADPVPVTPAQVFDARQSSSTKGMPAADLRRSPSVGGMRAPVMPPPSVPALAPAAPSDDASIHVEAEPPARKGRGIMIGAAVAAIGVIAVVILSFGLFDDAPGQGGPGGVTGGPSSSAPPPATPATSASPPPGAPVGSTASVEPVPTKASSTSPSTASAPADTTAAPPPATAASPPPSSSPWKPTTPSSSAPPKTPTGGKISGGKPIF